MDEIRNIIRPIDVPNSGLLCDLLCSDPSNEVQGWGMNDRGLSYTFGANKVTDIYPLNEITSNIKSKHFISEPKHFNSNYLFLGNYLDIGRQSLKTMWLLLAYKIKNPENLFMLRGNHEFASLSRIYGFYDECVRRFNARLHPCGFRSDKILCVHGGLSPELHNLDEIRNIIRPIDVPNSGLLCDLLCSDPSNEVQGWGMNDRGLSYTFGANKVTEFLREHDLDLICSGCLLKYILFK
ncbi:LOW QUALITY PROTEIN: hypothetical protein V2J09_011078 [Rumex salicifolius]